MVKSSCIRITKRGSKVQRCTFKIETNGKSRGLIIDLGDERIEMDLDKILKEVKHENENAKRKADAPAKKRMDK